MLSILLPVIKPELKTEFLLIWEKWFVTENTVEDEKCPGKLKSKEENWLFIKRIKIFQLSGKQGMEHLLL